MKALICTLNSKYIHSTLAPWCLLTACRAYCEKSHDLSVLEGTINENQDKLFERILAEKADAVAFSCYIWNIEKILLLSKKIKAHSPDTLILLGGPEVTCRQRELLEGCDFVDFILSGEGELILPKLLDCLDEGKEPSKIDGISYRSFDGIIIKKEVLGDSFNYPSPYCKEYFDSLGGRLAYIESSRGCPFSCAYCLSGRCGKVRFRSLAETKREILLLASSGTKTVKFIDRTFNCDNERTTEILRFIRENRGTLIPRELCFHFEICADIIKESFLTEVALAEKGQLQFEIGIQSLNEKTLSAIGRRSDKNKLFANIRKLVELKNCHIHTDLIAGLPFESYESFREGFNECYNLGANMLQLGFLKLLYGSPLRENDAFECEFSPEPPYEIISTSHLSATELCRLRKAEKEVDRLHNSARFPRTLAHVLGKNGKTPFDLFLYLGEALPDESLPLDRYTDELFHVLKGLTDIDEAILRDKLLYDRIATNNSGIIPKSLYREDKKLKKVKHQLALTFPIKKGTQRTAGILYTEKKIIFSDYSKKDPITDEYEVVELPFDFFDNFFEIDIDK